MKILLVAISAAAFCSPAWAEGGRGYVFIGPGGGSSTYTDNMYYAGGGGELLLAKGIGAAVDLQGVVPARAAARGAFGIFSLNGSYHPLYKRESKLDPYGTVGYSLAFRTETSNLWNYGVGMNYWFADRTALMVEFRDHPWTSGPVTTHFWSFRFGLSFR